MKKEMINQMWKHLGDLSEIYIGILCSIFAIFYESEIAAKKLIN